MNLKPKTKFKNHTPDELRELYEKNPTDFDELADDAIRKACIGRTPEQTLKRRQMQWTIDAQLRKGKTPLGRMQIMERIFYGQVYGDDGQLAELGSSYTELFNAVRGNNHITAEKPVSSLLTKSDDSRR